MRFLLGAGILAAVLGAAAESPPPAPARWVTDQVGFLSEPTRHRLDARLEAYERASGHQVLVWIAPGTGGIPLEDFTIRAVTAWKVGRKGSDDGLVLFLFSEDRRARIEVGYGLEGIVPDAIASRVIREILVPGIERGDRDGAIERSIDSLIGTIGGGGPPPPQGADLPPAPSPFAIALLALVVLLVLGFVITHPVLAARLFFEILLSAGRGGRGGGWGGGGGGGFSGGGGRFGGGGASGSW